MLASGRLPHFPGRPSGPAGFLQRISTLTSSSLPFFLDFLGAICRIATLSAANRYGMRPTTPLTNNENRLRMINPLHFRSSASYSVHQKLWLANRYLDYGL